jgi:hypothetical protein
LLGELEMGKLEISRMYFWQFVRVDHKVKGFQIFSVGKKEV